MQIHCLDSHYKLVEYVQDMSLPDTFFGSVIMLDVFLNKPGFCIYGLEDGGEKYLFIQKDITKELRLLFRRLSPEAIEFLKKDFDPPYIAYNELVEDPKNENQIIEQDIMILINETLKFNDGDIHRKYQSAIKNNTNISIKDFTENDKKNLKAFWDTWSDQKTVRSEKFVRHTDHDERFFDLYKAEDDFKGKAFYDGNMLVAYTILVPLHDEVCVGAFGKCLRGYTQLGLQIFIERLKLAQELGYEQMTIAGINNVFKKQFKETRYTSIYCYEVWRKESFKTKDPHKYSEVLFR